MDELLACVEAGEALVRQCWLHSTEALEDATVEVGVTFEVFEADAPVQSDDQYFLDRFLQEAGLLEFGPEGSTLDDLGREELETIWLHYYCQAVRSYMDKGADIDDKLIERDTRRLGAVLRRLFTRHHREQ